MTVLANAVALFAFVVKGLAGFGPALFIVPTLSLVSPLKTVVPYTAFLLFLANLPMLYLVRRHLNVRRDLPAALAYALGIALGTHALIALPEMLLKKALGLVLLGFALWIFFRPSEPSKPPKETPGETLRLGLASFGGGFLVGMVGAGALPFLIYVPLRYPKNEARALFTAVFALGTLAWTLSYAATGLLRLEQVKLAFFTLPGVLLGLGLGNALASTLSQRAFARALGGLLVLPALKLLGLF